MNFAMIKGLSSTKFISAGDRLNNWMRTRGASLFIGDCHQLS